MPRPVRALVTTALLLTCVLPLAGAPERAAQSGTTLSGRVTQGDAGQPLSGALVVIDELRRETRAAEDGSYRFDGVPPGTYHVGVRAEGYTTRRTEVAVGASPATLDLAVEFDLHFAEVLSVSPNPRPQFESYQPTSVLSGQDLAKQLERSIGATLESEPGLAARAFGSAPARPVIRGLDGDRVVVLEDGQRMGDLSSQSGDHGVPANPAAATKIEVVRGPATLLYGANAIGGLVNIVSDQIPTESTKGASGNFTFDLATNGGAAGAAGDVHAGTGRWAFHFGGSSQRIGDYATPEGEVANSHSRIATASVGGSWTGEHSYVGASYGYDDSRYGIPIVEGGEISLTPRRHSISARAGASELGGWLQSYRATFGMRDYEHTEFEGAEVGTVFRNDTVEGELLLSHRKAGALVGSVGGWFLNRAFEAEGDEALSPPVDQRGYAAFLYEEVAWPHATLQFGGRVDRTSYRPRGGLPSRDFTEWSASAGLLVRPEAANDNVVIAASVARAARAPSLEELYFFGPHIGNFAFEIGNPGLGAEKAIGIDLALRVRGGRFEGELAVFRNDINDFIFRNPIAEDEFERREGEFDDRFGVVHGEDGGGGDAHGHGGELPFVEYVARDSVLTGVEVHGDVKLTDRVIAEFTYDLVRGTQAGSGDPLPRIPPHRALLGLRYQSNALQVGGSVTMAGAQHRVFGEETPTEGYATLKLFGSYAIVKGRVLHTVTARLDNATGETYRNHLNYLKDALAEMGRSFKVVYSAGF